LLAADILVFTEARLKQSSSPERLQIQGFRNDSGDCSLNVYPSNVVVYFKPHAGSMFKTSVRCVKESNFTVKYDIFAVSGLSDCLYLISIYRSPVPGSFVHFFQKLEDTLILFNRMRLTERSPLIISGDFNIDLLQPSNASRQKCSFFSTRLLRQCVEYHTTDYGSLLDHVWTNLQPTQLGVSMQEAFWSDHVPVLLSLTLEAVLADA
jgi:exonuclease III